MLREIIKESQQIFKQREIMNLAKQTVWSLKDLFHVEEGIVGIQAEDGIYYTFGFDGRFSMISTDESGNLIMEQGEVVSFTSEGLEIREHSVNLWMSDEFGLIGFAQFVYDESHRAALAETDCGFEEALELLQETLQIAFENTKLNNNLIKGQEDTILSFAGMCEERSGSAKFHVKRVSEYVKTMARNMGYSKEQADDFALSAMMHDIGKMAISDEIIEKPDKLTDAEFEEMKSHVTRAEDYIVDSDSSIIDNARQIAREHHERWDGTGYLGMKEDEISELAAITAIADVFDVLISKRSYKDSWSVEEAYEEIVSQEGKQFSPKVVEAFKESFDDILEILSLYKDK